MSVRILVTGASGFIGTALCASIEKRGWHARALTRSANCQTNVRSQSEHISIKSLQSLRDDDWSHLLKDVTTVVHLAARAHVMKETAEYPLAAFRAVNTDVTERLALAASRAGVERFIFISSIGVNGEQSELRAFSETDIPNPTRPYAVSKWEAEQILLNIASATGLQVVIIRPPLVYGAGAKGNMLKLMNYVYQQVPLPLKSISNCRSFIGLGNLVDAILVSAEGTAAAGNIFLISDGEDISTPDLIGLIAGHMGKEARLFPVPQTVFTMAYRLFPPLRQKLTQLTGSLVVDSSKFRRTLKWKPPYSLREGMREMVSDFLSRCKYHVR